MGFVEDLTCIPRWRWGGRDMELRLVGGERGDYSCIKNVLLHHASDCSKFLCSELPSLQQVPRTDLQHVQTCRALNRVRKRNFKIEVNIISILLIS